MATSSDESKVSDEQEDDKPRLIGGYGEPWQAKLVRLAAAEEDVSRSKFVVDAAVERAIPILRERNPAALIGTPAESVQS